MIADPARLLVRAPNWLGDAVMALPAIAALRGRFAAGELWLAAPAGIAPLYEAAAGIDRIVPLPRARGWRALRAPWLEAEALSRAQCDAAVLFPNSFASALAVRLARIPERWGYRADRRARLLTRAVVRPRRAGAARHQAGYYLELVRALGCETSSPFDSDARLRATPAMREQGAALLRRHGLDPAAPGVPLVGMAPGAAYGHAKRWPAPRFAELAASLATEGTRCVLVGSDRDRGAGREIESWLGARGRGAGTSNLIGRTDLATLMGVMSCCRVFVTNDSGAMHVAAALGVPSVALFGPTDEHATAPLGRHATMTHEVWCRPCLLRECPIDHRCMTGIGVPAVRAAVRRELDRTA